MSIKNVKEILKPCPCCGSLDLQFCSISVRYYCRECRYWSPVNWGSKEDAIRAWNKRARYE